MVFPDFLMWAGIPGLVGLIFRSCFYPNGGAPLLAVFEKWGFSAEVRAGGPDFPILTFEGGQVAQPVASS